MSRFRVRVLIPLLLVLVGLMLGLAWVVDSRVEQQVTDFYRQAALLEARMLAAQLDKMDLEAAKKVVEEHPSAYVGYFWLADPRSQIFYHPPGVARPMVQSDLEELASLVGRESPGGVHLLGQETNPRLAAWAPVRGTTVLVGYCLPTLEMDRILAQTHLEIVQAAAAGALLALLLSFALAALTSAPVETMSRYARRVSAGENIAGPHSTVVEFAAIEQALDAYQREMRMRPGDEHDVASPDDAMPLTGLPGAQALQQALAQRIEQRRPFAVAMTDLKDFAPYNRRFGVRKGDLVLRQLAAIMKAQLMKCSPEDHVLVHLGADQFAFLLPPARVEEVCQGIVQRFDEESPFFYGEEERQAGKVLVRTRLGGEESHSLMSIAIAVSTNVRRPIHHPAQIEAIFHEILTFLKAKGGSQYLVDRRTGEGDEVLTGQAASDAGSPAPGKPDAPKVDVPGVPADPPGPSRQEPPVAAGAGDSAESPPKGA